MPPELVVERFTGLELENDSDDGDLSKLTKATNVRFENSGVLASRPGIRFFSRGPDLDSTVWTALDPDPTQQRTFYVGELRMNDGNVYQIFNAEPVADPNGGGQFFWSETLGSNENSVVSSGSPSAGGLYDTFGTGVTKRYGACKTPGAQYNQELFLVSGQKMRILVGGQKEISTVSGMPAAFDGWGAMCTHKDRIWLAPKIVGSSGAVPSRLYFSSPGDANTWPAANFIDVGTGTEDGPITAIAPFQGRLIILKTGGMWILETAGQPASWSLRQFDDRGAVGSIVANHNTGLYWVGVKGMQRFDGAQVEDLSGPIKSIFVNDGVVDSLNSSGCIYEDRFYFWVRKSDGTKKILVYDIFMDAWTEIITGLEGVGYFITSIFARPKKARYLRTFQSGFQTVFTEDFGPPGVLITMTNTGRRPQVFSMIEANTGSDAVMLAIGPPTTYTEYGMSVEVQTMYSDVDEPLQKKRVHRWELEWNGPTTTVVQRDEEGRFKEQVIVGTGSSLVRIGGIGYFRKLSLKFLCTNPGSTKFRFKRIWAKMTVQGRQIKDQVNQYVG
jgi:hypothetical protein